MVTVSKLNRTHALYAALSLAGVAVATALMLPVRARLDKAHVALIFLIVVLVASARGGRAVGIFTAVVTFLCFNFFFLPPYHTFQITDPLDWLILATYLVTAGIAAQLFYRVRVEAETARLRASEIERLSALGAETLNIGRAEDALGAIANVIRTTLHVAVAEVYVKDPREDEPRLVVRSPRERIDAESEKVPHLVVWVAQEGLAAAELVGGTSQLQDSARAPGNQPPPFNPSNAHALILPLRMRERTVGVLRLVAHDVVHTEPAQRRFIDVLSYYAALGAERVRLTAQAEHASALAEADRLKDALLTAVSHDLRTPLTTIKATAHEIAASGDARGEAIEAEANRLNQLVVELLDLSKLQAGAVNLEPQIHEAGDLIGAALRELSSSLGDRRVNVTLDPPDATLLGRFDFVHSLRVLVNLIDNANKYSPPDTAIDVGARRDGDVLVFSVADRGPGIANAERHLIYQPFYRSQRTAGKTSGTGLGLAIANRLVELQGGVLRHLARAGGGTVFVFRVPAAEALTAVES